MSIIHPPLERGMARVDDVQGYRRKYENQMDLLESADIDDRDRDAIDTWVTHLRANDTEVGSLGTVVGHLNRIRLSSERGQKPLVDFDSIDDVNAFKLHLEDVHGSSEGTIRNYMKAVRKFFLWRDDRVDDDQYEWADDVTVGAPPERKHDPDDNITPDELQTMFDACSEFDTGVREKALIALLRDTGLRIGAALSFQMKHVNLETKRGTLVINTDANVKDATGEKPVTWSRSYLSNWISDHPRPDDPEAPLFHKTRMYYDGDDPDDDGALTQQYAGRRIKEVAREADLDADRVHAHLFRGTAISEWILDDISDQKIKHRVDWDEDSQMMGTYSRVTDQDFNDAIFDHYDIGDSSDEPSPFAIELADCPICDATLQGGESICPDCGVQIDDNEELDALLEDLGELTVTGETEEQRRIAREAEREVQRDPRIYKRVRASLYDDE